MERIDPRNSRDLVNEFHDSYEDTIKVFSENHHIKILELCEAIAECHKKQCLFRDIAGESERAMYVLKFTHLAIDNIYVSAKLLALGYFPASGNSYRQAIESVCMAILLSWKETLTNKQGIEYDFFELYKKEDAKSLSHKSMNWVKLNRERLKVNVQALEAIESRKKHYNGFSHANMKTLSSRFDYLSETPAVFIGGGYDEGKKNEIQRELDDLVNFAKILPTFIKDLYLKTKDIRDPKSNS